MEVDLPPELWQLIFSYLELEDLCSARLVSRSWWDLINVDHLWKPLLLKRKITRDFVKPGVFSDDDAPLQSCDWSRVCSRYYSSVFSNWKKSWFSRDKCPLSTEYVVIRLPYMLTTFDPYSVVNVHKLVKGDFILSSRLPLPDDGEDGCFKPQMTCDSVFVVCKNAYCIVFRYVDDGFVFDKVICLTNDNRIEACSVLDDLPNFLRTKPHSEAFLTCSAATEDFLWIFDEISRVVFVYNFKASGVISVMDNLDVVLAHSTDKHVYCVLPDQISIHLLNGQRVWLYKRAQTFNSGFCWDKEGCGFIENRNTTRVAVYLSVSTVSVTELQATNPFAITLNETSRQSYCLSICDSVARIVASSLVTGQTLWQTTISPALNICRSTILNVVVEVRVVLGKYISIYGIDGNSEHFTSPHHLSLYSADNGEFLWSQSFNLAKIVHWSDQFIVTRGRLPRGGMRYIFEIYNFL